MPPPRVQSFDLTALPEELRRPVEAALVKPIRLFMDDASRAIERAWSVGDDLLFYEDVRVDVPADWIVATFLASWTNYQDAAYRKTENGDVEFQGYARAPGGGAVANTTIIQLPAEFRMAVQRGFICHTHDGVNHASCYMEARPNGDLAWIAGATAASQFVALNTIKGVCADRQPYQPAGADRWPLDLPYVLERPPLGLFLLEARERIPQGSSATRVPLGGVDWEIHDDRGVRKIRVRRVTGLTPGKSYILRLVAVGG